jgi:hypothetical protein
VPLVNLARRIVMPAFQDETFNKKTS